MKEVRHALFASALAGILAIPAVRGEETSSGKAPASGPAGPAIPAIPAAKPAGRVEGNVHSYQDDNGLYVTTVSGGIEHPVLSRLTLRVRAVADWITILAASPAPAAADPHAGHEGHEHLEEDENTAIPDAVSGASARVSTGPGDSRETRLEGVLGMAYRDRIRNVPVIVSSEARSSLEPDYSSWAGSAAGQAEFFGGATTVTAFIGGGRDKISPATVPPGQDGEWPATQSKVSGGFSLTQAVTGRMQLSAGASSALQTGRLSSPYRNSLVGITLFPEKLPQERLRGTFFLQSAWYLGMGTALHLRQGAYADDWGVTAWIPETAIASEFGRHAMLTLRHRFYAQAPARFYKSVYPDRLGFQTGDLRLGSIFDQTGAMDFEYRIGRTAGPITLSLEYLFSRREYPDLGPRVLWSQVFSISARAEY